jgi:hypothetical protein
MSQYACTLTATGFSREGVPSLSLDGKVYMFGKLKSFVHVFRVESEALQFPQAATTLRWAAQLIKQTCSALSLASSQTAPLIPRSSSRTHSSRPAYFLVLLPPTAPATSGSSARSSPRLPTPRCRRHPPHLLPAHLPRAACDTTAAMPAPPTLHSCTTTIP